MEKGLGPTVHHGRETGVHTNVQNTSAAKLGPRKLSNIGLRSDDPVSQNSGRPSLFRDDMTDFFSVEIFQMVLHNPTTAHRFLRFCQSRACGENIEFLQKVDQYHRLLDQMTKLLSDIQTDYISADSSKQINISSLLTKRIQNDIKSATQSAIPAIENIFSGAQKHVEELLAGDIYPRFVKHQVTASAAMALADDKTRYEGLGDCFCLTNPLMADNPITYASDGFVKVTGYDRRDIMSRNCRFLQGVQTEEGTVKRLRQSIDRGEETVELLLNYRKDGDPFWNLLYVSPLYNEHGTVVLFLGAQINCSTTIHSCTDILRILSLNDDDLPDKISDGKIASKPSSIVNGVPGGKEKSKGGFFESFIGPRKEAPIVREEAGMEGELVNKLGKLDFRVQVEAFYTAYSKFLVLRYSSGMHSLTVSHYSRTVLDLLSLNVPGSAGSQIYHKDIFKILSDHSSSASTSKAYKHTVIENIRKGKAISIEIMLQTSTDTKKGHHSGKGAARTEEKYVTHFTPVKDEHGVGKFVVLTIAPK